MIIDCFPFFDELDLLEIRVNELRDVVDVFVLTESPVTFSGINKPLYFEENKERFKDFNIVHTVYDETISCIPMERERRQKQYNLDYAFDNIFRPGDVMIQGDCDEIPKAEVIKNTLGEDWQSARLVMTLFYYYMNCRETGGKKRLYKNSRLLRPDGRIKYNAGQTDKTDMVCWDAGWHFSYLGDIRSKLKSWGHADQYDKPPFNTVAHIEKCKELGLDLIKRNKKRKLDFKFVEDISYLPQYVLSNLGKFDRYIKHG